MNRSTALLKAAGADDDEAEIVSKHLVNVNLAGVDSHGVLRLAEYVGEIRRGFIRPRSKFEVVHETNSTAIVSGNWGFGYKGYSLALVVEAFGGALTGNGCGYELKVPSANGVFILVVKIDNFVPLDEFKSTIDRLIKTVRDSPRAEGFHEILIPGEPERREEANRSSNGIPIPEPTWNSMQKTCREYGLDAMSLVSI